MCRIVTCEELNELCEDPNFCVVCLSTSKDVDKHHVCAGSFMMGGKLRHEKPKHKVTIIKPFYLQSTEVTMGQWEEVMGVNPSYNRDCGDDCPVENVSWDDIQDFIKKLNDMEGCEAYRLPTEAEWEYAARATTNSKFYFGYDSRKLGEYAWYMDNSEEKTHPVGQKKANAWGLHDMHGNVWEWVEDDWHFDYEGAPIDGRAWIDEPRGASRVVRGGCWYDDAQYCRSAFRYNGSTFFNNYGVGFRLAKSVTFNP